MHARASFAKLRPLTTAVLREATAPAPALAALVAALREIPAYDLSPALIEYTFFPLSHVLRRNSISALPNRVLEDVLQILSMLCERWYWSCEPSVWEQLVILATSVLAGLDAPKRDEETYVAAAQTLRALIRAPDEDTRRFELLSSHTSLPVIGKSLDALLQHVHSPNATLQTTCLDVLLVLVRNYFPEQHVPTVLPGVVSTMCRVALTTTRGAPVASALDILGTVIVRGLNDEICIKAGALRDIQSLDDYLPSSPPPTPKDPEPGSTPRTPAWLAATSTQTHIALNTLSPLLTHPNPIARKGLVTLCADILRTTPRTLAQSQTLLLAHLLVLAYPAVPGTHKLPPTEDAKLALESLQELLPIISSSLATFTSRLPHKLTSLLARQLTTASRLSPPFASALLGPSGGIQKWGQTLLHTLKFTSPSVVVYFDPAKLIEPGDDSGEMACPKLGADPDVEEMLSVMGRAAGDNALFAVEWFVGIGVGGVGERHVAAMWCALAIFRGARPSLKTNKTARWVGRTVAELWNDVFIQSEEVETMELVQTEYVKGLDPLTTRLDKPGPNTGKRTLELQAQHTSLALHLISSSHAILSTSSASITLLQYTLYPLLQALLSPIALVSTTAHVALNETSHALGYASAPNLLLANFDYALESVSSRLSSFSTYTNASTPGAQSGPSLSIQALQVLRVLVRLIGRAIVDRAYDVLDECFDRLDDYHGYSLVVQALIDVLAEVVDAVGREDEGVAREGEREESIEEKSGEEIWQEFVDWFKSRNEPKAERWEFDQEELEQEPKPDQEKDTFDAPPLPPTQSLTRTIIARATYFLTHQSPHIRAKILALLITATPTLRASALLPTIHASWPFILNRLEDKELWVVAKACELVEILSAHVGDFMARRVWDDIWPRFDKMLKAQAHTTLIRRPNARLGAMDDLGPISLGRLHLSILRTLTSAIAHVDPRDDALWAVLLACRRFLKRDEKEDVQSAAKEMYLGAAKRNADAVWLVLSGMIEDDMPGYLKVEGWDVRANVESLLSAIE